MDTPADHLSVYLNDHLGGAGGALELIDTLQAHGDQAIRTLCVELRARITEDSDELRRLMAAAGITTSAVRQAAGWLGEKAARLKLMMDDPADRGLRTFEMLEALSLGIEGKRVLWTSLNTISAAAPALRADYERLQRRAEQQRAAVEPLRLEWAMRALVAPAGDRASTAP